MCVVATIAGAAVVGAVATAVASSNAADAQVEAAETASATQAGQLSQTRSDLAPYRQAGIQPMSFLNRLTGTDSAGGNPMMSELLRTPGLPVAGALPGAVSLSGPPGALPGAVSLLGGFTQADLEATPGYQFTLAQGLKAAQNMGAKVGFSGGTLKGAADFATGLSDKTFNTRFDQQNTNFQQRLLQNQNLIGQQQLGFDQSNTGFLQRLAQNQDLIAQQGVNFAQQQGLFANLTGQQQNQFNRLLAMASSGQSSAAQTGAFGAQAAQGIAENQIGAGNAAAAGALGIGNGIQGGMNGVSSALLYNQLFGGGGGRTPTYGGYIPQQVPAYTGGSLGAQYALTN